MNLTNKVIYICFITVKPMLTAMFNL